MDHPFAYSVGRTPAEFIRYLADYAEYLVATGKPAPGRLDHENPEVSRALSRWLGLSVGMQARCDAFGEGVLDGVQVTGASPEDGYLELSWSMRAAAGLGRATSVSFGLNVRELERLAALADLVDGNPPGKHGTRLALEHLEQSYGLTQDSVFCFVSRREPYVLTRAMPVCRRGLPRARLALELHVLPFHGAPVPAVLYAQPLGDTFEVLS